MRTEILPNESLRNESLRNESARNEENKNMEPLTTAALMDRPAADGPVSTEAAPMVLFPSEESDSFRKSWHAIQGSFVDTPREAVQRADELVASVIQHLTQSFANERSKLEGDWSKGNEVSTEDLRQALRRYRSFFDRLLSV
jgi:hypothetical protein